MMKPSLFFYIVVINYSRPPKQSHIHMKDIVAVNIINFSLHHSRFIDSSRIDALLELMISLQSMLLQSSVSDVSYHGSDSSSGSSHRSNNNSIVIERH